MSLAPSWRPSASKHERHATEAKRPCLLHPPGGHLHPNTRGAYTCTLGRHGMAKLVKVALA
eukprot:scaffold314194_cov21-Tisochrysis_lutea.AAC.2